MEEIIITIDNDGAVTIATKGFKGKACLQATEQLEKALGGKVGDRKLTAEYREAEVKVNASH